MNKCRALTDKNIIIDELPKLQKPLNIGPSIRKQGLEKNPKLIDVGPTSFPEFGVINKNNYNSNWKNSLGFRNMLEKFS